MTALLSEAIHETLTSLNWPAGQAVDGDGVPTTLTTPSRAEYETWWAVQARFQRTVGPHTTGALLPPRQVARLTREGAVHSWIPGGLTQTQAVRCHHYYRRTGIPQVMLPIQPTSRWDATQHVSARLHLPIRPLSVEKGALDDLMEAARRDRSVLPRWHPQTAVIHHPDIDPGIRAGLICWTSWEDYVDRVVPEMVRRHRRVLRQHHVSLGLFVYWIRFWSLYADVRTGRNAIWRPIMSHTVGICSERTDQTCRRVAEELGLMKTVFAGRMLTAEERRIVRQHHSSQRGLANVVDFIVPKEVADSVVCTPPGVLRSRSLVALATGPSSASGGRQKAAASRRRTNHQRSHRHTTGPGDPIWEAAHVLTTAPTHLDPAKPWIPWLVGVQPGRLVGQLARYVHAGWTPRQLITALDQVNHRLGYSSPTRSTTRRPLALLAWYLNQIDPIADHPTTSPLIGSRRP